jgi:hypothetical protein
MEDSYFEFHTVLKAPVEALDWLEQKLTGQFDKENDEWESPPFMHDRCETDPTEMMICTHDGCALSDIVSLDESVCEMQQKFSLEEPWYLTWSEVWTEANLVQIGGGAMVCYKGHSIWMQPGSHWARDTIKKLLDDQNATKHEAD